MAEEACMARGMHWGGACMVGGMHGRGHAWQGACMAGGMHGRGHAWQGACMVGACMARGHAWRGGVCMVGEMATAVDGTHPTGMYSCIVLNRSLQ